MKMKFHFGPKVIKAVKIMGNNARKTNAVRDVAVKQSLKVIDAINIAATYAGIDGAHHKQWVIYENWITNRNQDTNFPIWDVGVAP
jgi:hypothetical protein